MEQEVLYDVTGNVATITINRPAQRNAVNDGVRRGLYDAFARVESDPAVQVAILTAAGNKAFCSGMDLKEAARSGLGLPPRDYFPIIGQTVHLSKPTIAAVNGVAVAGGWMFAQMCDLCVAAEGARFGITEARMGRGMPWAVPAVSMVQQRALMELLLTGELIDARRAREIGFVNRVVPDAELMDTVRAMAATIAANAPLTVKAAREMVYLCGEMGRSAALTMAEHLFRPVYLSEDAQEGPRAFREGRAPVWQGRPA